MNYEDLIENDKNIIMYRRKVVLKQFNLQTDREAFLKELEVLKKIKQLEIQDNGRFPVIISAKVSLSLGEILMTYSGTSVHDEYNIGPCLEDS